MRPTATERAFANAFSGAEDALVGFISTGKLEFQGLADSILADLTRMTVRQTITAPLAGALQSAFAGGGLFGVFHEGGVVGERPPATRYAEAAVFEHAPRYHGGGFAGSGLLPDEVPIIARRGELVVPPERVVREEKTAREQRPITVVVNVTAADASSFRASQGQIAADMARAIDRASRNRSGAQFRGAMETLKVLPWRLPQLLQRSFRSRSRSLVYGGRPRRSSLASMWVRFRAGSTGREDHMPGAQIVEPDGIARRNVLASFHTRRAMPERAGEQERSAPAAVRR